MTQQKALLVVIDTARGGVVKRYIKLPTIHAENGLDNPVLMRRADKAAFDIGVVRSIAVVDLESNQKSIKWD